VKKRRRGKGVIVQTASSLVLLPGHGAMGLSAPISSSVVYGYRLREMLVSLVRTDGAEATRLANLSGLLRS
jgi:hypothetical protein